MNYPARQLTEPFDPYTEDRLIEAILKAPPCANDNCRMPLTPWEVKHGFRVCEDCLREDGRLIGVALDLCFGLAVGLICVGIFWMVMR